MGRAAAAIALCALLGCSTGYSVTGTPDGWVGDGLPFPDGTGGSDATGTADATGTTDGTGTTGDSTLPSGPIVCNGDCRDLVVSRMVLPGPSTAGTVGIDHDGDGKIDNALAAILGTIATFSTSLDTQKELDESVYSGETLMLLRIQAPSFTSAASARAEAQRAEEQACCSDPSILTACKTEALASCFDGSHSFTPHQDTPNTSQLTGSISSKVFSFGPAKLTLTLDISGAGTLDLSLVNVHIKGTLTSGGVTGGVLAGAIPKSEVNAKLVPALTKALNDLLADPTESQDTKTLILTVFDLNKNGSLDVSEVQGNLLITTLLAGDVDFDKDGQKEISLGLAYEAVTATIK